MNLEIKIPSSSSITLQQFMDYKAAVDDIERLIVITGMKRDKVLQLKPETINLAIAFFEDECKKSAPFSRRFRIFKKFKSKQFGIIPNFNSMVMVEYISTDAFVKSVYQEGDWSKLIDLIAVLYRPITKSFGQYYKIEPYSQDKIPYYIDYLRQLPIDRVNGLLGFFLTLRKELMNYSLSSLNQI